MKFNVVIHGIGDIADCVYEAVKSSFNVVSFFDSFAEGEKTFHGLPVTHPKNSSEYDYIFIASIHHCDEIRELLVNEFGIQPDKVIVLFSKDLAPIYDYPYMMNEPRKLFLLRFAKHYRGIQADCAEVGVYKGGYAQLINLFFPSSKLYLFDTFSGACSEDYVIEETESPNSHSLVKQLFEKNLPFDASSDEMVQMLMKRMPFPARCVIKKGRFPSTFDISGRFCFVSLDALLYQPIKAGLELFYPLMVSGGVILVHDYGSVAEGVNKAVDDFIEQTHAMALPIGDSLSIAIIKN